MAILKSFVIAAMLGVSFSAHADVVVGNLSRAAGSNFIIDTLNNRQWLGFDVTKGLTYAQTSIAIGASGQFEGFNIARNIDAAKFGSAMAGGGACASSGSPVCLVGSQDAEKIVGENYIDQRPADGIAQDVDVAFFLSDNALGEQVGLFEVITRDTDLSDFVGIVHELSSFADADFYANFTYRNLPAPVGWLLYRESIAVPEPGSIALVALGLVGLGVAGGRRRNG